MSLPSTLVPKVLTPRRERAEPGVEAVRGASERRQKGVLEDRGRKERVLLPDEGFDQLLHGGNHDVEEPAGARPIGELEVPALGDLGPRPPYGLEGQRDRRELPEVVRQVVGLVDD